MQITLFFIHPYKRENGKISIILCMTDQTIINKTVVREKMLLQIFWDYLLITNQ